MGEEGAGGSYKTPFQRLQRGVLDREGVCPLQVPPALFWGLGAEDI